MKADRPRAARIAMMVVAVTIPLTVAASLPLVKGAMEERQRLALEERYKDGLSPCEYDHSREFDLVRTQLPKGEALSVLAFPSFSTPDAISVFDDSAYYVQFDIVRNNLREGFVCGVASGPPSQLVAGRPAQSSRIERTLAMKIQRILTEDVQNARGKLPLGLDGTTYIFRTAGGQCAKTWSPSAGTRAEKLVRLFETLAQRSQGNQAQLAESDRKITSLLQTLEED